MALINCPECGKEISDKAEKCIHCGYPIRNTPYLCEIIDGKEYDVSFIKDNSISKKDKLKRVIDILNCDAITALHICQKYMPSEPKPVEADNRPRCPKCGSTQVTTGARGVNHFWGFIGASKTVNRCGNCGHTWTPRG